VVEDLKKSGRVIRGWLESVSKRWMRKEPRSSIFLSRVPDPICRKGIASREGRLKKLDLITSLNGETIKEIAAAEYQGADLKPGTS
jgi:hypothetical protein